MTKFACALLAALAIATTATAQTNVRIRGTITSVDAASIAVKSRDGRDLRLALPENATVAVAKAVRFDEIKDGDYLGVTSKPGANGAEVAVEVHYLARRRRRDKAHGTSSPTPR
jgi:ribosomal protein S8E